MEHETTINSLCFHNIEPSNISISLPKSIFSEILKDIFTMRLFETKCIDLFREKQIRGFCHLDIGQECIYTALKAIIKEKDVSVGSYRCHALAYATGTTIETLFATVLGKRDAAKGGSMHIYNDRMFGGHGIVGAQVPIACGMAFSLINTDSVVFCFLGDGATNQGQVYESFNLANIYSLPIVFVILNNKYAMGTKVSESTPNDEFFRRIDYLKGIRIKGHDVFDVMNVLAFSRKMACERKPVVVQIDCFKFNGHSTIDDESYLEHGEKKSEIKTDCFEKIFEMMGNEESDKILNVIQEEMDVILNRVKKSEWEDASKLFENIYKE